MKRQLIALIICLCALGVGASAPAGAQTAQPSGPTQLFLPSLSTGFGPSTIFGVEVTKISASPGIANLTALQASWVRRNGLRWSEIEPTRGGGYRWDGSATRALEADLIRAAQLGLRTILVVHQSPAWAVTAGVGRCGPILPAEQAAFGRFLSAAVARYSKAPYFVKHWEIGNEPDAPIVGSDAPFGCWGDVSDPYYGGRAYGAMLKAVYPAIKAADPAATVLNGGLLLDQPYDATRSAPQSGRFFEGMLEAGAGGSFDMLSYHSYSFYDGSPDGTQGANDWKPAYLRGIMQRYGLSKPLINTETALLCDVVSPACTSAQAYAVPRLYARGLRDGLSGLIWFMFDSDDFRNTALVEPASPATTRPAHAAFAQARKALGTARFVGPISGLPAGVEGYRFSEGKKVTLVIWADTPAAVRLNVGAAAGLSCAEWSGFAFACAAEGGALSTQARIGARYITFQAP